MSLTSRVSNLFAGSSSTHEQNHNGFDLKDDGLSNDRIALANGSSISRVAKSDAMAQKVIEEEEDRPPYLHVESSIRISFQVCC